jgi:hypothetical protein
MLLLVFAAASMLPAAPMPCPTTTTLANLINLSGAGNGCISQDKIFNDFQYTGTTAAGDVGAILVFRPGTSSDIHGWIFAPNTGPWSAGFTLNYDITVAPGNPNVTITNAKDQINSGLLPNADVVMDTQTPNAGSPQTMTTMGMMGGETAQITFTSGVTMVRTASTATVGAGNVLQSYEQDWFESVGTSVPEPSSISYGLLGGGLLLLGLMRFKKT